MWVEGTGVTPWVWLHKPLIHQLHSLYLLAECRGPQSPGGWQKYKMEGA